MESGEARAVASERERLIAERAAELPAGAPLTPQELADHFAPVVFTGGPPIRFEEVGRATLIACVENGLYPYSSLLDIGSGALRLGYWLINFLHAEGYCGLEPDQGLTAFGSQHIVGPDVMAAKRPRFDHNADFDLTAFGRRFDMFVARSIWSHASKSQIRAMLDGFVATARDRAVFLVSYVPADDGIGYEGDDWVNMPLVRHAIEWIAAECAQRDLAVRQLPHVVNDQPWLRIERARNGLPAGLNSASGKDQAPGLAARIRATLQR